MLWHRSEVPPYLSLPDRQAVPACLPLLLLRPTCYSSQAAAAAAAGQVHGRGGRREGAGREVGECVSSRSRQTSGRGLWWLARAAGTASTLLARIDPAAMPCHAASIHPSIHRRTLENTYTILLALPPSLPPSLSPRDTSPNCEQRLLLSAVCCTLPPSLPPSPYFVLGLLHFAPPAAMAFVIAAAASPENGRKFATDELECL